MNRSTDSNAHAGIQAYKHTGASAQIQYSIHTLIMNISVMEMIIFIV